MWVCEAPKRLSHTYTLDYICTSISVLMGAKFNVWTLFGSFKKVVRGNSASPVVPAFFQEVVTSENDHLPHEVSHLKHCWLDGSEQHFNILNMWGPKFHLNSVLVWEWGIPPFLILCQCSADIWWWTNGFGLCHLWTLPTRLPTGATRSNWLRFSVLLRNHCGL
jgi:hypothetical protein